MTDIKLPREIERPFVEGMDERAVDIRLPAGA